MSCISVSQFHVSEMQENASWSTMEEFLFVDGMSLESDVKVPRAILQVRRQYRRDGEIAKARHSTV